MSTKRRDNKGRVLLNGEIQEESGRYRYRYIDILGKRREIYSWRLTEADPIPAGRRRDKSLREKEEAAMLLQFKGISGSDMTVLDLVERYISLKTGVKKSTQRGYQTVISNLKKEPFALRRIDSIKISDAKLFLIHLQREKGMSYSSIHNIRGVLRPAFQLAVDDDLIMKNPFGFEMGTVIQNDSKKREAITTEEKENFLAFVRADNHYKQYYDAFCLLFATGLRISEFCGLTTRDLDFKNKVIHVNKQLVRHSDMEYYIETTKTSSGKRDFPMDDEIEAICKRIIQDRKKPKVEKVIKGASGFLFYDKNDMPRVALHWEKYFEYAVNKYNRTHKVLMPKITPHVCRHTFCSEKVKEGMNPKALQYLMGHSDIAVTLNVYTHMGLDDARKELEKMRAVNQ